MPSTPSTSRRRFLGGLIGATAAAVLPKNLGATEPPAAAQGPIDFPLLDLHVHLDNSTLRDVLPLGRERGVRFGIVEHAGTKENKYPVVLSTDDELKAYVKMLDGTGVYKGIQTEWHDWVRCFSKAALTQLDFILTDAMTFSGKNGQRVKLWEPDAESRVDMSNPQAFMDRLVDWNVEIIATQPIDILANVSWLPAAMAQQYDLYWTDARIARVLDAAIKHRVALEISSSYKLPRLKFLQLAKAAGAKFSFGSNGRYPRMGQLEYSISMARELGLQSKDMFVPGASGQKAAQRRLS